MKSSTEYDIEASQEAAQSGIGKLLAVHEAKVLTRMIADYRSVKGLSPESAKIGIGVISELRALASAVTRTVERGRDAGKSL